MLYPKSMCTDPPVDSEIVDRCGKKCKGTVILLHDLTASKESRDVLRADMEKDFRVLTYTQRGHYRVNYGNKYRRATRDDEGKSVFEVPSYMPDPVACKADHGIDPYSIDFLARDLERVMNKHGIEKADLIGFSMGGFTAIKFASNHPERVGRVVIGKTFTRYHDVFINNNKSIVHGDEFWPLYRFWCVSRPTASYERDYDCNLPKPALSAWMDHFMKMDLRGDQERVKAKTKIIHCIDDDVIGIPVDVPGAKKVDIFGCGHIFNDNHTINKEVLKFLRDHE